MPALKKNNRERLETQIKILFKTALIEKGWTAKHLAELTGYSRSYISNLINHPLEREFRPLLEVSDKLGVNFGDAFDKI